MNYNTNLKYHYRPKKGWMNDPNGLIYFKGYYHAFYQHVPNCENPIDSDNVYQSMSWGHAITKDFLSWQELPVAISGDKPYDIDGCWSGTAIEKDGVLYLFYASVLYDEKLQKHNPQTVSVAYSKDGINFEKYEGNPVIKTFPKEGSIDFRDPAVIKTNGKYYLVMASANPTDNAARLLVYESENLFDWKYNGVLYEWLGDENNQMLYAECPSIMKCGDKYLLSASVARKGDVLNFAIMYGDFDGFKFNPEIKGEIQLGPDQYAGQAFTDHLGRNILISWIPGWKYAFEPVSLGCLSLPMEITVKDGKIYAYPVKEVQHLLKDSDENVEITSDGFIVKRNLKPDVVYKGNINDIKIMRDEYVLEIFVNGGEYVYAAVLN